MINNDDFDVLPMNLQIYYVHTHTQKGIFSHNALLNTSLCQRLQPIIQVPVSVSRRGLQLGACPWGWG